MYDYFSYEYEPFIGAASQAINEVILKRSPHLCTLTLANKTLTLQLPLKLKCHLYKHKLFYINKVTLKEGLLMYVANTYKVKSNRHNSLIYHSCLHSVLVIIGYRSGIQVCYQIVRLLLYMYVTEQTKPEMAFSIFKNILLEDHHVSKHDYDRAFLKIHFVACLLY